MALAVFCAPLQAETAPGATAPGDDKATDALAEANEMYRLAMAGELYSEAADASKLYIGRLLSQADYDKRDWGQALYRLGDAQARAGDPDAAIENYHLAIEVLEDETNRLDASLVAPLRGLARAQTAVRDLNGAVASYERAIHVEQVNSGLHSLTLADSAKELSEVHFRLGDYARANGLQQAHVSVFAQNYPDDYIAQVPARLSQAAMYARTGKVIDAHFTYNRIIADIEDADGGRSLELLPAIYQFSRFLQHDLVVDGINGPAKARRYLRRAVYIAEKHDAATPLDRADAYIALGDYISVQTADRAAAARYYQSAWDVLSQDDRYTEALGTRFGKPVLLNPIPNGVAPVMRKLVISNINGSLQEGARLVVSFDVGARGTARNIAIVEGDPTGYLDPIVVRHVRQLIFRPGFADNQPSPFPNQAWTLRYPYADTDVSGDLGQNSFGQIAD